MSRFDRMRPGRTLRRGPVRFRVRPGRGLRRLWARFRIRRVWLRNVILAAAVLYLLVRLGDLLLLQPLRAVAEVEARGLGAAAVNRVVAGQVSRSLAGAQVVEYEKDADGRIGRASCRERV